MFKIQTLNTISAVGLNHFPRDLYESLRMNNYISTKDCNHSFRMPHMERNVLNTIYRFPVVIKEVYLDVFGHVNNAVYLTLFEEARWDFITKNGYGLQKIVETQIGPTILELHLRYLKELRVRDEIVIESQLISYDNKIGKFQQRMIRDGVICCDAVFTIGLFDIKARRLISPTADWLQAIGVT